MTVIGLDDTDSREAGLCTTYVAARLADRVRAAGGSVERTLLVRLNPAVEYKTRGNAALAVHCDLPVADALPLVEDALATAEDGDEDTNPGAVVADADPEAVPDDVADFARRALHEVIPLAEARSAIDEAGYAAREVDSGRGIVGALAAVGAWTAFDEWTYECLSYRERERWGTERRVDAESVREAADAHWPAVWDTYDRGEDYPVCVPRTPCPVLHGIRGDDPAAVRSVAEAVESEPVADRRVFVTNQGTDAHLRPASVTDLSTADGGAYRVTGEVVEAPTTAAGGHVFLTIGDGDAAVDCAAFEPTKRFRDRVRALVAGDRITACGELADGTVNLEKFAVRELVRTESVTPTCPDCDRRMESAGRGQGYRCRDCDRRRDAKTERPLDRDLELGWYEVPPVARRHVARPLVRGEFDAPTHPER